MISPEIVIALARRLVAIGGLAEDVAAEAEAALTSAGARVTRVAAGASLAPFELAVVGATAIGSFDVATTPVLAVGTVEQVLATAQRDFVIAPPLDREELLVRSHRVMTTTVRASAPAASAVPIVVAADDDPTTTAIVRAALTQAGIRCEVASNGKRALELARELRPNAVVLDVNMPYLDGFEVLGALRGGEDTAAIPVIMLTSVQQEQDVLRGFTLGADDYVAKPFNPMELVARVKRLVRSS